ncbi:MAG: glycosyltransferase family 4 protein [Patescibacteria group bacterium]
MNILVAAYKFGTEQEIGEHLGTYHYFIEKMRRVVKSGHEVHVVCPWLTFMRKGSVKFDGITIHRYWPPLFNVAWAWPLNRFVRWWYMVRTRKKTLQVLNAFKCEVVYVWQARETGYALSQIKGKLGVPLIFRQITAWRWHFERTIADIFASRRWYRIAQRLKLQRVTDPILHHLLDLGIHVHYARTIYRCTDKVVLLSNAAVEEAVTLGLPRSKAETIGVAIEDNVFKPLLTGKKILREQLGIKGEKVICFIGRLNFAEKGIGWLLSAMPAILHAVPESTLVMVGGGVEIERVKRICHALSIEPSVQLAGKKSLLELVKFINASDVFVLPSLWMEAFGQVTIEAMSCGVPVVTSDAGASPEINLHGETGYVVHVHDTKALADAIIALLNNETLRQRFGRAARERVMEKYTYDVMTNKFIDIISSSINSNIKTQNSKP